MTTTVELQTNPFRLTWRCPKCRYTNGASAVQQDQVEKCFNCSASAKLTLNVSVIAVELIPQVERTLP